VIAVLLLPLVAVAACGGGDSEAEPEAGGWRALPSAPLERTEVGAARIGDQIYVVGGFLPPDTTTAAVERYDIAHARWQRLAPMPVAVNHPAVAALDGFLYVYGGYTDSSFGPVTGALQRFDPRSGSWRQLPPSPNPRAAAALAARGGKLYAVGGTFAGALTTLEVYDVERRRWLPAPPMATPREHLAAVATGAGLYVLGGRSDAGELATAERFDPATRRWSRLPEMGTPRSGFAAVAVTGRPLVFGGEELGPGGTTIEEVELFDPGRRRWRSLPPMLTPRHGLGGVVQGHRVYAVEGGPSPGLAFSNAIEVLAVPPTALR
jgi:N-acetylneuraminic acid mutarotase